MGVARWFHNELVEVSGGSVRSRQFKGPVRTRCGVHEGI